MVDEADEIISLTKRGKRWMRFCEKHSYHPGDGVDPSSEAYQAFEKKEAERQDKSRPVGKIKKIKKHKSPPGFHHPHPL